MPPSSAEELSVEDQEKQAVLKQQAAEALDADDTDTAMTKLTEAIAMGCATALMHSKRAEVLLQLSRYSEAINDCTQALAINPDSGKAFKIRARTYASLKEWDKAVSDFQEALKIDYDDALYSEAEQARAAAKDQRKIEASASRQLWEIVGGSDKGGVLVREGRDLSSQACASRLSTGAVVMEVEVVGDRLHYEMLTGTGPAEGWISTVVKSTVLACRTSSAPADVKRSEEDCREEEPPFPVMSPSQVTELSEADLDRQAVLKEEASAAQEDGNHELALAKLSEAIALGCASAPMYSRRATTLLQMGRPRGAINDCTAALVSNPDSGKAYKIRARAHAKLKHWAQAHSDFQTSLQIDYDDDTYNESLHVAAKAKEIQAMVTEKRVKSEEVSNQRKQKELQAQKEALIKAHQAKEAEIREKEAKLAKFARDPVFQQAKKNGYMTDFVGAKRGRCNSCKKCDFYLWRPVRLNS